MKKIYLGIGSNIGDRAENIISALSFLQSNGVLINKISSFYETSPVGPKQRNFYNITALAQTSLHPQELLIFIKQAEPLLGRKASKRWGARIIDIDVLFYEAQIIKKRELEIPHKEIQNRLFVLEPLCEIAPNLTHPVLGGKIKTILKNNLTLKNQKVKIVYNNI